MKKSSERKSTLFVLGLIFGCGAVLAQTALAQQTGESSPDEPTITVEEEIVVSATRTEVPTRHVGSSVTVIDRAEIEARDKVTVPGLLRTVPGLEIVQTGGPGGTTSVFMRGANSNATLVLVDPLVFLCLDDRIDR